MNWYSTLTLAQAEPAPAPPSGAPAPAPAPGAPTDTTGTQQPGTPAGEEAPPTGGNMNLFFMLIIFVVIFYLLIFLPQRREKKRHQEMLGALAKGAKVITNSGIIGTVVEVRPHEIVVKVDEASNTRMRFIPDAIRTVISEKEES